MATASRYAQAAMDAMTYRGSRIKEAWLMAKATHACSYFHGCGFWASLKHGAETYTRYMLKARNEARRLSSAGQETEA